MSWLSQLVRSPKWRLGFILLVASVARIAWRLHEPGILQGEECEYLRLAQSLQSGHYIGITPGVQLMYPPLLPLLINIFFPLTLSLEGAAALVTLLAGVLLVAATYALAERHYGPRAGFIAGAVVALHPVLVAISGVALSEPIYLPLLVGGALYGLGWLKTGRRSSGLLAGTCFGLAYLTRPDAILLAGLLIVVFLLSSRVRGTTWTRSIAQALPFVAALVLISAPYIVFLSIESGSVRLEGKSVMNYAIGQRINSGMSAEEAEFGIAQDLHEDGPWLAPNAWLRNAPSSVPPPVLVGYWFHTAPRNFRSLGGMVLAALLGPRPRLLLLAACALVALGLTATSWSPRRAVREAALLTLVLGYLGVLLGQHIIELRFVLPVLPFLLVWISNGLSAAWRWSEARVSQRLANDTWVAPSLATVVTAGLAALCLLPASREWEHGGGFRTGESAAAYSKEAGLWLARVDDPPRAVMSDGNEEPYYSGSFSMRFPYTTEQLALEYIRAKAPNYIVLVRETARTPAYYTEWLAHGIPAPEAVEVHKIGPAGAPGAVIYAWHSQSKPGQSSAPPVLGSTH
jgi:4-amino-4-deoxy-L-arabinose transferase-like glycosyltransferase